MPKIIQFIHDGPEAKPLRGSSIIPWNYGKNHKRKFMLSQGKYISNHSEKEACLTYWGEWEPQSFIEKLPLLGKNYPTILNRPFIDITAQHRFHNTDPYIFGEYFKYFFCKQSSSLILRNLEPMSLILFGSNIAGQFCLDTLFVVSDRQKKYKLSSVHKLGKKGTSFYHTSLEPLLKEEYCKKQGCKKNDAELTYYEGVTFSENKSYQDIFSFAPVRLYNPQNIILSLFKRPEIILPHIISNNLNRGFNSNKGQNYSIDEIINIWNLIVIQVKKKDLLLGSQFIEPPFVKTKTVDNNKFIC